MGIKLSTKRRRGRSYSFTEKDKPQGNSEVANNNSAGSKKSKRSVSSAAKFSNTRESYVPKVCK